MRAVFNRTGQERKDMVAALFDITGIAPKYMGVFSQAYQIGSMEVTKDGTIEFGDTPAEEAKRIVDALIELGIRPEDQDITEQDVTETVQEQTDEAGTAGENDREETAFTVSMPRDFFTDEALENLKKIIESKGALMKSAFHADDLPVLEEGDTVSFPWFTLAGNNDADAYSHFIAAICSMAKNQKRISAKEKAADNEKYAFRCFLLRLGFIGAEFKEDRKVLLKNLEGSSAFKSGQRGGTE